MKFFVFAEEAEFPDEFFEFPVILETFAIRQETVLAFGQKVAEQKAEEILDFLLVLKPYTHPRKVRQKYFLEYTKDSVILK